MVVEALCDVGTPILSHNNLAQIHIMKLKWLVADVTAVESSERAERAVLRAILAGQVFGQFRPFLWKGSHCAL